MTIDVHPPGVAGRGSVGAAAAPAAGRAARPPGVSHRPQGAPRGDRQTEVGDAGLVAGGVGEHLGELRAHPLAPPMVGGRQ